jgi:hypothetical protein
MFEFLVRAKRMSLGRTLATSIAAAAALPQPSPAQTVTRLPVQEVEERPAGEELIGPYAQPRWSARGRFSADTDVYVLPPYSFYFDLDYDGTFPRKGQPDHLFVQEYELGLPCRFQIAWEFYQEAINGHRQIPFTLIEGRYAFADWGKIPLNPTLLAEFKWGTGKDYFGKETDRGEGGDSGEGSATKSISNSYEIRLLLGQEIGKSIEFAANLFLEQKLSGDRERELGISTAWSYALRGEALKIGIETKYSNESQPGKRHLARNIFELGPGLTYKPSPHTRIDAAPLAGIGHDSPYLETFLIFSIDFGTGETKELEEPASSRLHR